MFRRAYLALAAAVAVAAPAAGQVWFGTVNGSWSNANNWFPAFVPTSGNNTALQFQIGNSSSITAMTNDIAGTFILNKITVLNVGKSFTLAGNPLDFRTNSSAVLPTIVMSSPDSFTANDNAVLTNNLTVSGTGTGTFTFGAFVSGAGSLTQNGAGTLSLGATNTFTGGTSVTAGTLALGTGTGIPTNGNVTTSGSGTFSTAGLSNGNSTSSSNTIGTLAVNGGTFRVPSGSGDYWLNQFVVAGGTIDFTGSSGFRLHFKNAGAAFTVSNFATWTGIGTASIRNDTASALQITNNTGALFDLGMILSGSGGNPNFTLSGNMRLSNTGNTGNITALSINLFTSDVSTNLGSGAFGTLGTGTITLSSSLLVYDGPTSTSAKPITLTNGGAIEVVSANGTNLTMTGAISQSAAGVGLTVFGNGNQGTTLTLTAANSYSGPTNVSNYGTLAVPGIADGGVGCPVGASSNAPANLVLGDSTTRGTVLLTGTNAAYSTDRGATVQGLYSNSAGGAIGVQNAGTTLTVSGQITGSGSFIKTGAGTLALAGNANNYQGGTYIEAGTLLLSNGAIPAGRDVTVSGGATFDVGYQANAGMDIGTLTLAGGTLRTGSLGSNYYLNKLLTDTSGGTIDATGAGSLRYLYFTGTGPGITINGDSTWAGPNYFGISSNATELPITIAPNVTVTSSISLASGPYGDILIGGGGTLYLTGNPYYTANIRVNQARLRMDNLTGVYPGGFDVTLDAGTLQYGGGNANAYGLTIGPGGGSLEILNPATTLTLVSSIPGSSGGLTKSGPGTLVLYSTTNQFNVLTINAGVVQTSNDSTLGTGPVTINGGSLRYTGSTQTGRTFYLNGAAINVGSGATLTFNGATVNSGFLRGAGNFAVTGGTVLAGTSTTSSTVMTVTGPGAFQNFSNGGLFTIAPGLATPTDFDGVTNQGSGAITVGTGSQLNAADFQTYGTVTLNPGTTAVPTQLANTGSSPLFFNGGSRTFLSIPGNAGQFDVGIDLHGSNAVVAGGLLVNNGYVVDSVGAGTKQVIADFGSLVKGAGFFENSVQTVNGGKFQAGNSPGRASFGSFVLGPRGVSNYVFAIDDAAGTAGPSPDANGQVSGWGLVQVMRQPIGSSTTSGDFIWTAQPTQKLTVALQTLVNPTTVGIDVAGPMAAFDPTRTYSWSAVQWAGNYAGPSDANTLNAATAFDTTGFANPIAGTFGWQLDLPDHTLALTYTPSAVPEPSTLALTAAAALACAVRRRKTVDERGATIRRS
jgi:autotransporter-associated beta strand protein